MIDENNNVYKYTACRRRFETYTKRCHEIINKEKIKKILLHFLMFKEIIIIIGTKVLAKKAPTTYLSLKKLVNLTKLLGSILNPNIFL